MKPFRTDNLIGVNPLVIGVPSERGCGALIFPCVFEQTLERTSKLPVIWDAMALIWRYFHTPHNLWGLSSKYDIWSSCYCRVENYFVLYLALLIVLTINYRYMVVQYISPWHIIWQRHKWSCDQALNSETTPLWARYGALCEAIVEEIRDISKAYQRRVSCYYAQKRSCQAREITFTIFITRDSVVIMFSPCVFVCVCVCIYVCLCL